MYVDRDTGELKRGYPERPAESNAPQLMLDSMPKTYHQGVGREIESRKEWALADKESGTLTFSSQEEVQRHVSRGQLKEKIEYKASNRKASSAAYQEYKENPKAVKERLAHRDREQTESMKKSGLENEFKKAAKEKGITYE